MNKRNWFIGTVLAGTLLTVGAVGAVGYPGGCGGFGPGNFQPGGFGPGGHGGRMAYVIEQLDLDQGQREAAWKILDEQREQMVAKRGETFALRQALREQMRGGSSDLAKVRELADAKAKLMADRMVQRAETMNRLRALLTPEQLEKLDVLQQSMPMRRGRF